MQSHPFHSRGRHLAFAAAALLHSFLLLAFNPAALRGSIAYGSINNFDTVNDTGQECHGFEIELDDCHSTNITYTYDYNHYGTPEISEDSSVPGHPKVFIRWQSKRNPDGSWAAYTAIPSGPIAPTDGHMFTNPSINFGGEHFGVGYIQPPSAVHYRWLVDGGGVLVSGGEVQVSTPVFNYIPPAAGNVPQVQAVIAPPPPPAPEPKEFGKPLWVKEIRTTTHNNKEVKLRDLVSDDPNNDHDKNWRNGEPDEVEVEWQLLQFDSGKIDGGANNKINAAAEKLPQGDEVVTRRYEFYKYLGPIDEETGEAMVESVNADCIHGKGTKTINGVSVDLSQIVIVGDYTGAQMSAVDVDAAVGLIDHVNDAWLYSDYASRTIVVPGALPFTCTFQGSLPAGMSFDEVTGILSGTPQESGAFNFKIVAWDEVNPEISKNYVLNVSAADAAPLNLLDTSALPVGGGTTSGDGAYSVGAEATVHATSSPGYVFVNWTDNGNAVSSTPDYTLTMDVNHSLVANFVLDNSVNITAQPQSQLAELGSNVVFSITATGPEALLYQWRKNGSPIPGAVNPSFTLTAVTTADEADYDVVITDSTGSRFSRVAHLQIIKSAPTILTLSLPILKPVGAALDLEVTAEGQGVLSYQWYKGGAKIKDANTKSLHIDAVRLEDAGTYRVDVTGTSVIHSGGIEVGIVDDRARTVAVTAGLTATLQVESAGQDLTFAWQKDGNPVQAEARIKGIESNHLSLQRVTGGDTGAYTLLVTGPGGSMTTQAHQLNVISEAPVITEDPPQFPAAMVGAPLLYLVPVDTAPAKTPTRFTATGLPPGLRIDSKSGAITGKPTTAGNNPLGFAVTLTAANAKGKSTASGRLQVAPLGAGVVGEFAGIIARDHALNGGLGGFIDVFISSSGAFTGRLALGTAIFPFKGTIDSDPAGGQPLAHATVSRKGLSPLNVDFAVDAPNQLLVSGSLSGDASTVNFTGWRKSWDAKLRPATAFAGYHTFALDIPAGYSGDATVPQGNGYGACTVSLSGQVTLAGKLADGEGVSGSTFLGPNGGAIIFRTLYASAAKGSVSGLLTIGALDLNGSLTWSRPASTAAGGRLYPDGFPDVLILAAQGGRYSPPPSPQAFLGLAPGAGNARLTLSAGGIESAGVTVPLAVSVGLHSKASVSLAGGINPRRATLTLSEKTGAMLGSIALEDANPLPAPSVPRVIKRTTTFQGIAVPIAGVLKGYGFFLLPQLPGQGPPPTTVAASPVLSGQVSLETTP